MIPNYHFRVRVENNPDYYYRSIQTDVIDENAKDPANPGNVHKDFCIEYTRINEPTSTGSGLTIHADVGSAIVDDQTVVTADLNDVKYFLVSVVRDEITNVLEILVREKVLGNYAEVPVDKIFEQDIDEYLVVANGTDLVKM